MSSAQSAHERSPSPILSCKAENYKPTFDQLRKQPTKTVVDGAKVIINDNADALDKAGGEEYDLKALLIAMLDHAIYDDGKLYVATVLQIANQDGPNVVVEAARGWREWLCQRMITLASGGSQPYAIQVPEFDNTAIEIEAATRAPQKRLKTEVALREQHTCPISQRIDSNHFNDNRSSYPNGTPISYSETAHIFPLGLNTFSSNQSTGVKKATITWEILRAWAGIDVRTLAGEKINTSSNAIFMSVGMHRAFANFELYFDKDTYPDDPNKYMFRVGTRGGVLDPPNLRAGTVTFSDTTSDADGKPIAPPCAELLKVHAAIAHVVNASYKGRR